MHAFGMRGRVPPVANSLAPLGDSRIQGIAFDGTTTNLRFQQENYLNCANMLGGQFFTHTGNWGVNGSTTTGMLSRLSAALASRPAFLAILGGVNDPGFGIPRSTTLSNLLAMADAAVAAGVRPILHTDWGSQGFAPTLCAEWQALNDGVRAYCARTPRAILADLVPALLSSTTRSRSSRGTPMTERTSTLRERWPPARPSPPRSRRCCRRRPIHHCSAATS